MVSKDSHGIYGNQLKTKKMKNLIIFVLVLLGLECFSQQGNPICPYNENGYSVLEVKKFALNSSEISKNFCTELLIIVNSALKNSEENLILNEKHIDWIFQHVKDSAVVLNSFTNSCKIGNTIKFYSDKNFTGIVGVFSYKKCKLILYKTICMNLLRVSPIINGNNSNNTNTVVYIPVHDTVYVNNTEKVYVDRNNSNNNQRWSASSGTQNYTYWNNWNPPYPNYAPMGGAYNYNYGHYNGGGGNCNNNYGHRGGYRGHRGNGCNNGSTQNYGYNHSNNNGYTQNSSYGTPSNYGYSHSNGPAPGASWSTPTNYNYSQTGWLKK